MYQELTYSNLCKILEIPDMQDNNEVDIEVLKRDVDDRKIDIAQGTLDEVEIEDEIN